MAPNRADPAAEWVRRAQAGDAEAFAELYRQNLERVYAICLRISADRVRAEELTQDVFVRAWEKLSTFRGGSAFSTWLHRVAVNLVIEAMRTERRWHLRFLPEEASRGLAAASGEGARGWREATGVHVRIDLERAVASLPPGARTVLVLRDIEGYKYEEVAKMTGLSLGTVKAQIHRARRLLRSRLDR